MSSRTDLERSIRTLSDDEAVRALTALAEDRGLLPAARDMASEGGELKIEVAAAELEHYAHSDPLAASQGELARRVLAYAVTTSEELAETAGEAVAYARSPMDRFDPVTLSVAALAITFLQTEVTAKRDADGKWSLAIRKRAMRDSSLGRVLTALLSQITGGK
ncbi:hypothetical protein AB0C52_28455 [Streptomyces sp. NPDC048717]|uniref:hypothetical protein n=1 Tax=Streptomyces sp. NPDC048717 TaxID=3154928 RepID=UPI003436828D